MSRATTTTARTTTTTTSTARKGNTVKSTTTTARKTAPATVKSTARKTAPATVKSTPAVPVTYRGVAVDGYTVRWPHGGYDLLKTTDASADRPAWLVRCNDHGTVATVENTRDG